METLITCTSASCNVLKLFFVALILPLLSAFALLVVFILRSRFWQNKDDSAGDEQRARIAPHR